MSVKAKRDQFAPPADSIEIGCSHCGGVFQSRDMKYNKGNRYRTTHGGPIWWCPNPKCDGAGIGFDLFPTDSPMGARIKKEAAEDALVQKAAEAAGLSLHAYARVAALEKAGVIERRENASGNACH